MTSAQVGSSAPLVNYTDRSSADVVQWAWDFGDGSPVDNTGPVTSHSYAAAMPGNDFYSFVSTLVVTNAHGCVDTIAKPIEIKPTFAFYIPNAFTPNGDDENSLFFGKGIGIKEYDICVFDRWGLQLWTCHYEGSNVPWDMSGEEGMSSSCKWDGTYGGRRVEEDVYVWKVKLTDVFGKQHDYIGRVSVVY